MRNDKYFLESLTIALVVPIIIGALYFRNLYIKYNVINPIIAMDSPIEIIDYDEQYINTEINNGQSFIYYFDIDYLNGKFDKRKFSIYLNDLNVSSNNVKWYLIKDNNAVASGVLESSTNKKLILADDIIHLNDTSKYAIQFYLNNDSSAKLKAKLVVE